MIHSISEIQEAIDKSYDRFADWLKNQPDADFTKGPEGKWSTGQHLGHLIQSTQPLNIALIVPKMVLSMKFGKPNRDLRTYDEVVSRYLEKLSQADLSNNPYGPKEVSADDKAKMINTFLDEKKKLIKNIDKWKEKDLDKYLLPHPLIGRMLVRELLFFMVYHTEHHLNTLKKKYVF